MKGENNKANLNVSLEYHCPRYSELPKIPLYKEQVINYIEEVLSVLTYNKEETILTPTMLNNYVKQKVLFPPENKKYNRDHLAYLIVICILKHVLSISEISELIDLQMEKYSLEYAYDCFCVELENSIDEIFKSKEARKEEFENIDIKEVKLIRASVLSVVNKAYVQKILNEKTH